MIWINVLFKWILNKFCEASVEIVDLEIECGFVSNLNEIYRLESTDVFEP